jgi:acyl carrier protein
MDIKDFVIDFCNQIDESVDEKISPATCFREFEQWSSVNALDVLAMIDDKYGVDIDPDDLRKIDTIQELFDLVQAGASSEG